ncbi:MAG: histone deacetylase [Candidatus Omnitrophica bacterium]|nr:histone deacetylase [Candidatus Omnitrophota bacterium]
MKNKIVYSERYYVDIGAHVFPSAKYRLIKKMLLKDLKIVNRISFIEPATAEERDLLRVHTSEYLDKLQYGKLSQEEILTLELPYTRELVDSAVLSCGGTILAADIALEEKLGIHLGGGFHHAFPDHGEGFCILNDIAVAAKKAVERKNVEKVLIIDCDLHQGNGTAAIFADDEAVFTFSIHQENNYPFYKPKSNLDIGLHDRAKDREYLECLERHVPKIISDFRPKLIIYVAGADPYEHDQIGNLAMTKEGLGKRDLYIYTQARNFQVPIAVVLAGGYALKQEDTVEIQFNTIRTAIDVFNG